jgi:hypothetical protein
MRTVRKTTNRFGFGKLRGFEIAKLELKPSDTVVLRTEMHLTEDQCTVLREHAAKLFPGHKVVVLHSGLSLAVLTEKQTAA